MKWQGQLGEGESTVEAANLKDEVPYLDGRMRKKSARNTFTEAGRIVHHILWQYLRFVEVRAAGTDPLVFPPVRDDSSSAT